MSIILTEPEYKNRKRNALFVCSRENIDDYKSCLGNKCKKCKGSCCKRYPCTLSPRELLIKDLEYMKNILNTGVLAIAPLVAPYYSEESEYHVIRPRSITDPDTIVVGYPREYPNPCILLGKNGCILDSLYRPTTGLLLVPPENPKSKKKCTQYYDEEMMYKDWAPHQEIVNELIEIYKDVEIPKPIANEETAKIYSLALRGECQKETK